MPTSSSLRITGALAIATPSNSTNFFANANTASFLATIKMNSGTPANQYIALVGPAFIGCSNLLNQLWLCQGFGPGTLLTTYAFQSGGTYFISGIHNASGTGKVWVNDYNGTPVNSVADSSGGWAASSQMLLGQFYNPGGFVGVDGFGDYQIQDLAISPSYLLTNQDVLDYRNQAKTPLQIDPSFSWWPLGGGTVGATPALSDAGFQDQNARGVNFNTLLGGSLSSAVYANPLVYTSPTVVTPQVSKRGQTTFFVTTDAGSGTPQPVTAVVTNPTINVQFSGMGSFYPIQTWGPLTSIGSTKYKDAFACYQNICGPVQSVVVQNGGQNYSMGVTASITSGGSASDPPILDSVTLTGGVTSYSGITDSGGHSSPPAVMVGGDGFGAQATATLTSGTVTAINVFWPGQGYGSATCSWAGGSATAHVSKRILSVNVAHHGTGCTSVPTITFTDSTGTGAVAVPIMGGIQGGDVVTYSGVSDGWLSTTSGIAGGVTGTASVANYGGTLEPGVGGVRGFNQGPTGTFSNGFNVCQEPSDASGTCNEGCNWLKRTYSNGTSWDINNRPLTTAATAGSPITIVVESATTGNGTWTLVADELTPATPMSVTASIRGPATVSSTVVAAGTSTTGVTSVTLGSGGSGYTDRPRVTLSGGGGSGATAYAKINSAGTIIGLFLISPGTGYTTAPSVVFTPVDGNGSGASGTTTTGSILSGKTWQFVISGMTQAQILTSGTFLQLNIWNPGQTGTYAYTLFNEYMFSPQETALASPSYPSRSNGLRVDGGMKDWLVSKNGNGPAVLRFMSELGYGLAPGCVEAEDIRDVNDWQYYVNLPLSGAALTAHPTGPRVLTVTTVRTWVTDSSQTFPHSSGWAASPYTATSGWSGGGSPTWVSPSIYTNQWGTANATWTGYGSGADTSGPFQINLTATGAAQNILNYRYATAGNWYVGEMVTSAPHNFKTGQMLTQNPNFTGTGGWNVCTDAVGGVAGQSAQYATFLFGVVTGASTIAFTAFTPGTPVAGGPTSFPGGIYPVAGSFAVDFQIFVDPTQGGRISPETAAGVVASLPGCGLWLNIPFNATDACVASICRRARDIMPLGSKTYIEFSNEIWNFGQPWAGWYIFMMGQLKTWNPGGFLDVNPMAAVRTIQVDAIARTVYNATDIHGNTNRGGEIIGISGGQEGEYALSQEQITYWNAASAPLGGVCMSDYESVNDDPDDNNAFVSGGINVATAVASTASHWPTSTAYLWPTPWSRGAVLDYWRYQMKYDQQTHGPFSSGGWFANEHAALATFTGPGPTPQLYVYEGGISLPSPYAVEHGYDPDGSTLYFRINGDLFYDPAIYDVMTAWLQSQEAGGVTAANVFQLAYGGPYAGNTWLCAGWHGQPVGHGDGSLASNGQNVTNLFWNDTQQLQDFTNVSPILQAYQDWQDGVNGVTATTATLYGPVAATVGVATSNFTVSLNGLYTGTVTPAVSGVTGSFTPTSLSWSGTSNAQTFTFTATSAGTASVSISASPTLATAGSPISVTVSSSGPSLDTFVLTTPSTATAGLAVSISVMADLSGGGADTGYRGTVAFTSNDPHAVLPANYTYVGGDAGVHSFPATFATAGAKTITATDTVTPAITGTSAATAVAPATPTTLMARAVSTSQINLSWQAAAGATAYQIQESATGTGGWSTIGSVGAVTSYAAMGLTNLTQYFFRIYATGGGFDSTDSNVASATTGPQSAAATRMKWFGGMRRPTPRA